MKGQRSRLTSTDEVISGRIWSGIHDGERIQAGLYLYFICVLFGVSRLWRTDPVGLGGLLQQMEAVGIARLVLFQCFWDGIHARYDL